MIDASLSFVGLLLSGLATFGIDLAASATHQKLKHFLNSRKLSNYGLLECLREAYDLALNSLWDDYSLIEEPENVPKEKMQEYLQHARIDRDKIEGCIQRLRGCKDQVFPSPGKGIKKTPFTDKEIRHLVTNTNGEEERERIMGIISPILDVCGAPETFKSLVEDLEAGFCFRIIFYLKGKIKTDEKARSILFFEILIDLGRTQEQIRKSIEKIKEYISGQGLPIWTDLDERLKQLEITVREEGEKSRIHTDERIGIAEQKIIKEVRKVTRYEFEAPLSDFSIENQLDFENRNGFKPKFFREMGPMAVDFKDSRVAPRDDIVPQLIENMKERNLVIAGKPASGKSIILRCVGYQLFCERKTNVYYIPLKERRCPQTEEIRNLQESTYVLIDDGHLNPEFVWDILHPPSQNVRILVATRLQQKPPEMETSLPGRLKDWQDEAITIEPEDAIDSVIRTFEFHSENKLYVPEEIRLQIKKEYGFHLWLLSWALETYRAKSSVQEGDILEKVKDWLVTDYKDGLKSKDRDKINDFAAIILLLSSFYQYEIPVDREFVNQFLAKVNKRSKENIDAQIKILLRNCTIAGDQTFITLHHSELAEMFLKTASEFPEEQPFRCILPLLAPEKLYSSYLRKFPQNSFSLLSHISYWKREGENLINSLVANNKEAVMKSINHEKDVEKIGNFVRRIHYVNMEVARKIVEAEAFDKNSLIQKLNEESNVEKIGSCVSYVANASKDAARKIIEAYAFNKEGLIRKLNNEKDVERIVCGGLKGIAEASEIVAMELVPVVAERLYHEKDFAKIGWCVRGIAETSKKVAIKLIPVVAERLKEERDVVKIEVCMLNILHSAMKDIRKKQVVTEKKEVVRRIVTADTYAKKRLIQKLNDDEDVEKIWRYVGFFAIVCIDICQKIFEDIHSEVQVFIKEQYPTLFMD